MRILQCIVVATLSFFMGTVSIQAQTFRLVGTVKNTIGEAVPFAQITVIKGSEIGDTLQASSDAGGQYAIQIGGSSSYNSPHGNELLFQNFPNPFSGYTTIPFRLLLKGWVQMSVHDWQGRLVKDLIDQEMEAGEYTTSWDGTNFQGVRVPPGIYSVVLLTQGSPEAALVFYDRDGFYGEPLISQEPFKAQNAGSEQLILPKITVSADNYEPKVYENVTLIEGDNSLHVVLYELGNLLYKVDDNFFYVNKNGTFEKMIIHGINLGVGTPGKTPGMINYVTYDEYYAWFEQSIDIGFNVIRVYTLHGPQFYEALRDFNTSNPDNILYLFQGIWLDEVELDHNVPSKDQRADLYEQTDKFKADIAEVIDCVHGNNNIASRPGRANGVYTAAGNVSRWTIGYLIGREVYAAEVLGTNEDHPEDTEHLGTFLSITNSSAAEAWLTMNLDHAATYEDANYGTTRPVGFSSWPTLDVITHPYNVQYIEDMAQVDLNKVDDSNYEAGVFVSYHAYPYFPDFIGKDPSYQSYTDDYGSNAYLGYLHDLRSTYPDKALLIAEYGVPSSWGNARFTTSNMHHGGHNEQEQGEYTVRMFNNILDAGCAGGIVFAQMNEWFKFNWITYNIETYYYTDDQGALIFSRTLWHNQTNPEQNYGLLSFEPIPEPLVAYDLVENGSDLSSVKALTDFRFFNLELNFEDALTDGETIYIAIDTYDKDLGESILPNQQSVSNRAEFLVEIKVNESALLKVTEAYNMCGNAPGWIYPCDPNQQYKSVVANGRPWYLQRWITDNDDNFWNIGDLGIRKESETGDSHTSVVFGTHQIDLNLPWTMLYFADPTRLAVAEGDRTVKISDGIAVSISRNNQLTETNRYVWEGWKSPHDYTIRKKKIYNILKENITVQ